MSRGNKLIAIALGALVALMLSVAVGASLSWAPDKPVEALKARWAQPPSQFIAVQGMQVHLRDEGPRGDPEPVVLLHGTSASLHTWEGWAQALRATRRVIRFDLPGFALTGPSPDNDYSTEAYVRFVGAMLDTLGVSRCVLAGNSLGGQIAWSFALAQPERVSRLILVDASGYPPKSQSVPIGFRIARMPVLRELMQNTLPMSLVEASVKSVYGDPAKVTPQLVALYADMTLRAGNRRALVRRLEQGYLADYEAIKTIRQPTLILWGGKDRLIPPEFAQRFRQDIALARLVVFDALGHVPHEEDPQATVAAVQRFLAQPPG
jgi:pimeloyl-ACP methyl ester carboxylesterase